MPTMNVAITMAMRAAMNIITDMRTSMSVVIIMNIITMTMMSIAAAAMTITSMSTTTSTASIAPAVMTITIIMLMKSLLPGAVRPTRSSTVQLWKLL